MPDSLFNELAPWAIKAAERWCGKNRIDSRLKPDCIQEALIACWLATKRVDPAKGKAKTFCMCRMVGAIKDYLRGQAPCGYRSKIKKNHEQIKVFNNLGCGEAASLIAIDRASDGYVQSVDARDMLDFISRNFKGRDLIVWVLLSRGMQQREIAKRLSISPTWVYKISERLKETARRDVK